MRFKLYCIASADDTRLDEEKLRRFTEALPASR